MKTAILISGQCRTLDLCLPNIKAQVLDYFPGADLWISVAAGPDSGQAQLLRSVGMKIQLLEALEPPELDQRDYAARSLGGPYLLGTGLGDSTAVSRTLLQAWRLHRVFEKARSSGENYDTFVRLRPDQWFIVGAAGLPRIDPSTAAVPWWGGYGGINDRFAVLGRAAAEAYCWWPRLDELLAEGCRFHPETLTKYALTRAQCRIVHLPTFAAILKRDAAGKILAHAPEVLAGEFTPVPPQF